METFPYTSLMDRLDGREIGLCDTEPREVLKILANVHRRRVASRGFSYDLKEFSGKVIHHHGLHSRHPQSQSRAAESACQRDSRASVLSLRSTAASAPRA